MKKAILLISLSLVLSSCGQGTEMEQGKSTSSNSLESLQAQKTKLTEQINSATLKLEEVNAAIDKISVNEKRVLVTAFPLQAVDFKHTIEVQANIKTRQNLDLYPEFGGKLDRIYVKEGQLVSKGALLAKVDDAGLQEQMEQIKLQLDLAKTTFERTERLWNQKIGSEMMYLEAKTRYEAQEKQLAQMKRQLAKTKIYAPFSGTIDQLFTNQGANVAPGVTPILRIVNLKSMYVEADVPENYLTFIVKGSQALVEIPVLGQIQSTLIRQTGNYIQPSNRTFRIEAPLENPNREIKPNLNARVHINDYTNENALLIPQSVISENAAGEQYAYVAELNNGEAIAKRHIITTGKTQGDFVEITSGISAGDLIIKEGARSVKDAQAVKILN